MQLIRVKLENWRGVQCGELVLDSGVTIVEGANEAGKSSFIEALNLLFRERDSTKKQVLKRVAPKGVDVGSFVEVELKSGDYHFTYSKTFNKKSSTSLFLHAPEVLQLTGAAAHDRVEKILEETIDFGLWQAIQLEQGNDFTQVNLKSSDSLARALDTAVGGSGAGDGESVLFNKVRVEYLQYYTEHTAKETGALAKLRIQVGQIEEQIETDVQKLKSMEGYIERSARLASEYQLSQAEIPLMQKQLEQYQQAQLQSLTLQQTKKTIDAQVQAQKLTLDAIESRLNERKRASDQLRQMQADVESSQAALAELDAIACKADQALVDANTDRSRLIDNRLQIDDELHVVELAGKLREKLNEGALLSSRLERITDARQALNDLNSKSAGLLVDDKILVKIEVLEQDRRELELRLGAKSPELRILALQDTGVTVNGDVQMLERQCGIAPDTSTSLEIQIADIVSLQLIPASDLEELQTRLSAIRSKLQQLLHQCAVSSVSEAVTAAKQRSVLLLKKDSLEARYQDLLDGEAEADLWQTQRQQRDKITRLEKQLQELELESAGCKGSVLGELESRDADGLERLRQEIRNRLAAADHEINSVRKARDEAQSHRAKLDIELGVARQKLLGEKAAIALLQQELDDERRRADDSALEAQVATEQLSMSDLEGIATNTHLHLAAQNIDDADTLVKNTRAALNRATADLQDISNERVELRTLLNHLQAEGLHEKLELLRAEHDDVSARLQGIERAASSAQRLWTSLCHHQRLAQQRYARPLAQRLGQMGKLVFGDDFSVQLSESLTIESRTLNGLTVPFADLSGGAREQLGILLRLAAAQLVSGEQGMPLILDDTLGHTDPDRLETMGAILSNAGRQAQIVVMTCYPRRYRYVGEARVVKLDSGRRPAALQLQLSV